MPAAHVLVVDDDRDTREMYRLVLESAGYGVSEAATIAGALRQAALERPDVVLTDWRLADGTALSFCEALGRHGHTRNIPIVVATGMSLDPGEIARVRTLGCHEVLTKPMDLDTLVASVRGAHRGRKGSKGS